MATEGKVPFFGFNAGAIKFVVWLGFSSAAAATGIAASPDFLVAIQAQDVVVQVTADASVVRVRPDDAAVAVAPDDAVARARPDSAVRPS